MTSTESMLQQLLTDCIKHETPGVDSFCLKKLSDDDWKAFTRLANVQRVSSLVWHRLKQNGLYKEIPSGAAATLQTAEKRNIYKNLLLNRELRPILTALREEGIPLILLKGIYLSNLVYENISLREMNDIDVMAQPEDFERVAHILRNMGFLPMRPYNVDIVIKKSNHLPGFIKKGNVKVEVHWNLTKPNTFYGIDPQGLWKRSMPVSVTGVDAYALCPEDLLLHICLHTTYQHSFKFGLRPFCDIAEIIRHFGPILNWKIVIGRACELRWRRGVHLALYLANEFAGADIPRAYLDELRPPDVDNSIFDTIRTQVFTPKYFALKIKPNTAEFLENTSMKNRLMFLLSRIFLPKETLSYMYGVPADSSKIYSCYIRRIYDLIHRHAPTFIRFKKNDPDVHSLVQRTRRIERWLEHNP